MPNIISQLQVTKKNVNNNVTTYEKERIPIGVYSNNIIISDNDTTSNNIFSLTQLYEYLKNFFNREIFSWYGYELPLNNEKIINFYQIEDE